VATYRDTEAQRGHPFFATLSRLAREPSTSRIVLGGLSPAHCARWLTLAKARGAAGVLGDVLHRETNGNPFFLGEIVRTLRTAARAARRPRGHRAPARPARTRLSHVPRGCGALRRHR